MTPDTFTLTDLMREEIPPTRWAIDGLIPEGLTLLAGRPKAGKSWLAHHLGLAVATERPALGFYPCRSGSVLYLALEDNKRRLKTRSAKLMAGMGITPHERLCMAYRWPKVASGGMTHIEKWLDTHPDASLIIIDTLAKLRDNFAKDGKGTYADDYEVVASFQRQAMDRGITNITLTHTRKPKSGDQEHDDPLDEVTGTTGITGAADTIMVLRRNRQTPNGRLFITGRDIEETALPLKIDMQHGLWRLDPDSLPEDGLTPERRDLIATIRIARRPMTITEIAEAREKDYGAVAMLCRKMVEDGQLACPARGKYTLPELKDEIKQPHDFTILTIPNPD